MNLTDIKLEATVIVTSVSQFSFENDSKQLIEGTKISYINPQISEDKQGFKGTRLLSKTLDFRSYDQFKPLSFPSIFQMHSTLVSTKNGLVAEPYEFAYLADFDLSSVI